MNTIDERRDIVIGIVMIYNLQDYIFKDKYRCAQNAHTHGASLVIPFKP